MISTTERTCWAVPASAPQGADAVTAGLGGCTGIAFGWAAVIPSRQSTRNVPMTARQVTGAWCIFWSIGANPTSLQTQVLTTAQQTAPRAALRFGCDGDLTRTP